MNFPPSTRTIVKLTPFTVNTCLACVVIDTVDVLADDEEVDVEEDDDAIAVRLPLSKAVCPSAIVTVFVSLSYPSLRISIL